MSGPLIAADELRRLLDYDQNSGVFRRKVKACRRLCVGQIAGSLNSNGYLLIQFNGRKYRAHRLAWMYVYGHWPPEHIDHIDGDKTNNRISNLRVASHGENKRNCGRRTDNTSGFKGVCWSKIRKKWIAYINYDGKRTYLGYFSTPTDAHTAYCKAAEKLHGKFARVE